MNFFLLAAMVVLLAACNDDPSEDLTESVNKNGSVESSIEVRELDSQHQLLLTTHKVWIDGSQYRTITYSDTLPTLGSELKTAATESGEELQVSAPKEYEVYITVK